MKLLAFLVQTLIVLVLSVVVAGFFGKWHFVLDLCSHFRVQAATTLVFCGLVLFWLRRHRWALLGLGTGLGLVATLWPYFLGTTAAGKAGYRLLTFNVLATNPHHDKVIDFLLKSDPDIIVLQETTPAWIESLDAALVSSWPYHKSFSRADNFGIAMYSKLPWVRCDVVSYSRFYSTPSLAALFELPAGLQLQLITTHPLAPMRRDYWKSRNLHFSGLAAKVRESGAARTIVAGDFNCTPWSTWYRRLLDQSGLQNAAEGHGLKVTWMPIPFALCGIPIDHVLIGPEINVLGHLVGPDVGSDHRPVIVEFD